jgi:CRISPR-associated protein Csm5
LAERVFEAEALTPVHVGSGERLAPEDYLLDEKRNRLVRVRTGALLADLGEQERRRLEDLLRDNDFRGARQLLATRATDRKYWAWEVAVGGESLLELKQAVAEPERWTGEVLALQRNPYSGAVIVPGSAIKGAIRTALLSACLANPPAGGKQQVRQKIMEAKKEGLNKAWQVLESVGFQYERSRTEADPMRLIRVADAEVRPEAVRVDRAVIVDREGSETQAARIQMHVERLVSRADGGERARFTVKIGLAEELLGDRRVKELFGVRFGWGFVERACNWFFGGRWREEAKTFAAVGRAVGAEVKLRQGEILLRVGRFCHFESLSVEEFRQGWDARRGQPIRGMGSTRTLCYTARGSLAPFGWILLRPEQQG